MSFMTIGHPVSLYDVSEPGKALHFEYVSAASEIGPRQAFFISHGLTKTRFAPGAANDFFQGLDGLVRGIRSGRMTEGSYFSGAILDFDNVTTLIVDFGVASSRLYFRLGDEEIEIRPDDLDRLNEACRKFHPLARSGRRGMSMGRLLAQRYREGQRRQDMRQQAHRSIDDRPWNCNGIEGENWWKD